MNGSLRIGTIAGIGLFIHWTFTLLIAYFVFSNYRAGNSGEQLAWSILFLVCIFITVILHELGHSMAARRYGIRTKDITLLPIGGVARLESMPKKPSEELVVALAGPAVNLILMVCLLPFVSLDSTSLQADSLKTIQATNFLLNLFFINGWLALFNLIPAFPMDGGRVFRALLSFRWPRHQATNIAARLGQIIAIGFVILGFSGNPFLIFIGLFIFLGAQAEQTQTQTEFSLHGATLRNATMRNIQLLSPVDTLFDAAQMILNSQSKSFLVMDEGKLVGTLNREALIGGLTQFGKESMVQQVMLRDIKMLKVDMPLEAALEILQQQPLDIFPVLEQEHIIGAVDFENLTEFIMLKQATAR